MEVFQRKSVFKLIETYKFNLSESQISTLEIPDHSLLKYFSLITGVYLIYVYYPLINAQLSSRTMHSKLLTHLYVLENVSLNLIKIKNIN